MMRVRANIPTYSLLVSVVHESVTLLDQLPGKLLDLVKVVTSVNDLVPTDTQHLQIPLKGPLEFVFFLFWVGVVKSKDEFALVLIGEESVENAGFDVTNVEVTGRLGSYWRHASSLARGDDLYILLNPLTESHDDFSLDSVRQLSLDSSSLLGLGLGSLGLP